MIEIESERIYAKPILRRLVKRSTNHLVSNVLDVAWRSYS